MDAIKPTLVAAYLTNDTPVTVIAFTDGVTYNAFIEYEARHGVIYTIVDNNTAIDILIKNGGVGVNCYIDTGSYTDSIETLKELARLNGAALWRLIGIAGLFEPCLIKPTKKQRPILRPKYQST